MRYKLTARLAVFMVLASSAAFGVDRSFQGRLGSDDGVQLFSFNVNTGSVVTLQSFGYGGGTNANGDVVEPGGFDSFFTWYAEDGTQIGSDDDGCGAAGSYQGSCSDAYFNGYLDAGSYWVALSLWGNRPLGALGDGFTETGNPTFSCEQGFCDPFGNPLTGAWAVDILGADYAAELPEPGTWLLSGLALAVAETLRRKYRGAVVQS